MIIVFGAINMDINVSVPEFPNSEETVLAHGYEMFPGGKAANQSLACIRTGAKTALVGKVGDDAMAHRILNSLRRNGVLTSGVATSDVNQTGITFLTTNARNESRSIFVSAANSEISSSQVPDEILKPGSVLLLQMEIPFRENFTLMERAKARGVTIILNLAPAFHISQKALEMVDYLILNEPEARAIADVVGLGPETDLMLIAKTLSTKGDLDCVVTLGTKGALAMSNKGTGFRVPSADIGDIVDVTGAVDCFCGTFAAGIQNRLALGSAMRRASIAASLCCTKYGGQDSYPYIDDIEKILETFPQAEPC